MRFRYISHGQAAQAQLNQSRHFSHTQNMKEDEASDQNLDILSH